MRVDFNKIIFSNLRPFLPGVFVLQLLTFKGNQPSLAIEINPVNTTGTATKKGGVVIRSSSKIEKIKKLMSNPKVIHVAKSMDEVNPKKEHAKVII